MYDKREEFMQPVLESLVQAQGRFLSALVDTMGVICKKEEMDITDAEFEKEIEANFEELNKLSITSDHK